MATTPTLMPEPPEVVWAHAAGAPSNGIDDDTPVVQSLLDNHRLVMFEPGREFWFNSNLTLNSMARLRSLGPGNSDLNGVTSSAKLNFRGSGSGCFVSANPTGIISHGGFNDITIRAIGEYEAVFNLPNCVEMTWDKCTVEALGQYTGGIRAGKTGTNPAWINKIMGCSWRLKDLSDSWVADLTWSDSEVIASHFTGGLGSIDRGYGVAYIGNQFERSRYRALRISKELEQKQGNVLGNRFDANSDVGLEIFVDDDLSSQLHISLSIAYNQFRTRNANTGAIGSADILYTNNGANQYRTEAGIGNVYTIGMINPVIRNSAKFASYINIDGNLTSGASGVIIDDNGLITPRGLPYGLTSHSASPEGVISAAAGWICMTPGGPFLKTSQSGTVGWKKLLVAA